MAQLIAWLVASGKRACSAVTGGYCSARDRLPEQACRQLACDIGHQVDEETPSFWRWLGHRVLNVDGSTITMADTPDNQAEIRNSPVRSAAVAFP